MAQFQTYQTNSEVRSLSPEDAKLIILHKNNMRGTVEDKTEASVKDLDLILFLLK
jgi:hypothetical protein